jgi:hypothetical protein
MIPLCFRNSFGLCIPTNHGNRIICTLVLAGKYCYAGEMLVLVEVVFLCLYVHDVSTIGYRCASDFDQIACISDSRVHRVAPLEYTYTFLKPLYF